ncbi:hypothetical protein VNI00_007103 [Paramarasmius palmivorus]|uniref:Uncharacterized protein n=1 Tax=Paramarasmius palmivorus TaxID=297713 RepID=A0AAW0D0S3_9AGAR
MFASIFELLELPKEEKLRQFQQVFEWAFAEDLRCIDTPYETVGLPHWILEKIQALHDSQDEDFSSKAIPASFSTAAKFASEATLSRGVEDIFASKIAGGLAPGIDMRLVS